MGQPIVVVEKPSQSPGLVRFEANRTLSGSGHQNFRFNDSTAHLLTATTTSAELARRLFATGRVVGVHVYQNMVTVNLEKDADSNGLYDIVRDLYQYWKPGMVPPSFEDVAVAEETPIIPSSDLSVGSPALDSRVPVHLFERSRLAREKWQANQ